MKSTLWNGLLPLTALRRKLARFVINGAVRDIDGLRVIGLPVKRGQLPRAVL